MLEKFWLRYSSFYFNGKDIVVFFKIMSVKYIFYWEFIKSMNKLFKLIKGYMKESIKFFREMWLLEIFFKYVLCLKFGIFIKVYFWIIIYFKYEENVKVSSNFFVNSDEYILDYVIRDKEISMELY